MAINGRQDRFEVIGIPSGSTADVVSSAPIGTPVSPGAGPFALGQGSGGTTTVNDRNGFYPITSTAQPRP